MLVVCYYNIVYNPLALSVRKKNTLDSELKSTTTPHHSFKPQNPIFPIPPFKSN